MRQYNEGASLLTHVDRTPTHAASLIINVAQGNIAEPWKVEIYDHANRLHQVEMEEGDIVYYESAKCLHGRMATLKGPGAYYVNLFAHYRPDGDPEWSTKPVPEGQPEPIINLEGIDIARALPHIAPTGETLHSGADLFNFWQKVVPQATPAMDEL